MGGDRIPIEGKFGQGKRRFSLARIMCKLAVTSVTAITVAFVVMNLEKWLKSHFFSAYSVLVETFGIPGESIRPISWVQEQVRVRFANWPNAAVSSEVSVFT